jgi:hypothetical protein
MDAGGDTPQAGDLALSSMIQAHSLIMNGGVHHAIDVLSPAELEAAVQGFAYFDLGDAGRLLSGIPTDPRLSEWTDETEPIANDTYNYLVPDDECLERHFRAMIQTKPNDFAPI